MAGNLFDVFVVGATDPSTAGETRLAAALSAKHGVPLATVAKAISAKNLRAGQGLDQAQAQALVRHLQSIGAVTVIRPVTAKAGGQGAAPAGRATGSMPAAGPAAMPGGPRASAATPAPGGGWPGGPSALPPPPAAPGGVGPAGVADPFAPLPQAAPSVGQPGPYQPNRSLALAHDGPAGQRQAGVPLATASGRPSASGLAIESSPGPKLELARADRGASEDDLSSARSHTAGSAVSLREMGMSGSSGVAMDEDPKNLNLVRCVQHGLYYDKTKASGCRKCLSPAREAAIKMTADPATMRLGNLRNSPGKRAFLGLLFALLLGFLPAAYYCFGPGAAEVRKVRVEQELLSRQPGTEEIIKRFEQLDSQVPGLHEQATRNVAIVWVAVSSVCLLGWYKIT